MNDYYKTLGLERNASDHQIKRAFRRLAMKYHPDRNRGNEAWADTTTRLLIEAYHTLLDQTGRMVHDAGLRKAGETDAFLRRMRAQRDDPTAQTRLMLYCLLNDLGTEALDIHKRLSTDNAQYDPADHLDGRDHGDFLFLIAELYELRNRPHEAAATYEQLIDHNNGALNNKFYFRELQQRLRDLYFRTLPRRANPKEAIRYYRQGLAMKLPKKERAFAHKKIAECYVVCGPTYRAHQHLAIALRLQPNLKGTKKLREKLAGL